MFMLENNLVVRHVYFNDYDYSTYFFLLSLNAFIKRF